jgi:hypothetical protein
VNYFSGDKLTGKETREEGGAVRCPIRIGPSYTRPARYGRTIRMFECKCGSHAWSE